MLRALRFSTAPRYVFPAAFSTFHQPVAGDREISGHNGARLADALRQQHLQFIS
jgi:hypothetical protein